MNFSKNVFAATLIGAVVLGASAASAQQANWNNTYTSQPGMSGQPNGNMGYQQNGWQGANQQSGWNGNQVGSNGRDQRADWNGNRRGNMRSSGPLISSDVAARPYDNRSSYEGYSDNVAPYGGVASYNNCVMDLGYGRFRDCSAGSTGG
jgi:hypothetical protein